MKSQVHGEQLNIRQDNLFFWGIFLSDLDTVLFMLVSYNLVAQIKGLCKLVSVIEEKLFINYDN